MKRAIKITIYGLLITTALLTLSACGESRLIGRWEGVSVAATFPDESRVETLAPGEVFWEINQDGTGLVFEGMGAGGEDFTWRTEEGRLYFTYRTGETVPMDYNISGSTLTITMRALPGDGGDWSVVMTLRRASG